MRFSAILVVLLACASAQATTINVPADQSTIQAGINAALDGDTVLVSDGLYYERIDFSGKGIVVASHYILDQDTAHIIGTIIDADTTVLGASDTGSVVLFVNWEDSSSSLSGLTLRNGTGIDSSGGVVYCWNSSPVIRNCVIRNQNKSGCIFAE